MAATIVCQTCEQRLMEASNAMRRHESLMYRALSTTQSGLTNEQRIDFTDQLYASLNDAQSAWDAYREHLIEHGLLPLAS